MGPLYMGKTGLICHFPRALPAGIQGHLSQVLVFTSTWGAASAYLETPKPLQNKGKCKKDKSTLFYPPTWDNC